MRHFIIPFIALALSACTATQRISVKQSQGEQTQETEIETNTKFDHLSLSFINNASNEAQHNIASIMRDK